MQPCVCMHLHCSVHKITARRKSVSNYSITSWSFKNVHHIFLVDLTTLDVLHHTGEKTIKELNPLQIIWILFYTLYKKVLNPKLATVQYDQPLLREEKMHQILEKGEMIYPKLLYHLPYFSLSHTKPPNFLTSTPPCRLLCFSSQNCVTNSIKASQMSPLWHPHTYTHTHRGKQGTKSP